MDRAQIARDLVDYHVAVEDEIIYASCFARNGGDLPNEPIKVLEVNRSSIPAGVVPVYFGPTKNSPPVVLIEVTEAEFRAVRAGSMRLPEGWDEEQVLHSRAA